MKRLPPKWLSDAAKRYFRKLAPMLDNWDCATQENLAVLCDCYATYARAAEALDREGLTTSTQNGLTRAHPASRIKSDAASQIRALSKMLNITKETSATTDEVERFFKD